METLVRASRSKRLDVLAWGFDPALAYALRYASAESLLTQVKAGYALSDLGKFFLNEVLKDPSSFEESKKFLSVVGKSVTEAMVEEVSKGWDY